MKNPLLDHYWTSGIDPVRLLDMLISRFDLKSDAELARWLGLTPPAISKVRHDKAKVGPAFMLRIHMVSEMPVKEICELATSDEGPLQLHDRDPETVSDEKMEADAYLLFDNRGEAVGFLPKTKRGSGTGVAPGFRWEAVFRYTKVSQRNKFSRFANQDQLDASSSDQ